MKFDDLFPSRYLKATDLEGPTTYTIEEVFMETLPDGTEKAAATLRETPKKWIVNVTNARIIQKKYGSPDNWAGKKVTLCNMPTTFQGKVCDSIRVLENKPKVSKPTVAAEDFNDDIPI